MSGQPPYIYLAIGDNLVNLAFNQIQYLYDQDTYIVIPYGGDDLFETGCTVARLDERDVEHPIHSYDIRYPYCRTALRYNMADIRADPQIGQLVAQAPFVAIRIMLDGCDQSEIASVQSVVEPAQPQCAASIYPGYAATDLYAVVDIALAVLPLRLSFAITNTNGVVKRFWIGVRDSRKGMPSGAVVPPRPSGSA